MNIVTNIKDWQLIRKKCSDQSIGFIPTMGNLHQGHLSLCEQSIKDNAITVVSIFVNPTQFNQAEDYESYPRTLSHDMTLLSAYPIDYVLTPLTSEMYADENTIQVIEHDLSRVLEGEFRPGHFNGMLTVVLKLLNLVRPTRAYFGEKDYQQYLLIKKMVQAFFLEIDIIPCSTQRAEDGLALSSRNSRLTAIEREQARHFPRILHSTLSFDEMKTQLETWGFRVEYIAEKWGRRLGAVWLNNVRLIDNVAVE